MRSIFDQRLVFPTSAQQELEKMRSIFDRTLG
jgi:hypothetical protein